MNSQSLLRALLIGAALSLPSIAGLAAPAPSKELPFATFDEDGDGYLSETEFNEARTARMMQRAKEGGRMHHYGQAPSFSDLDGDGDGRLSEQELNAGRKARNDGAHGPGGGAGDGKMATFDQIDTDDDGCISREELDRHHAERHQGTRHHH